MVFQHTTIRNCLHLPASRPVTGMTGWAACRTMRMNGMALKMGVCLSEASFAHLAMTGILKGMGVSGGRLFLDSFFFGGTKKNESQRVSGNRPGILSAQKEKVYTPM